MVLVYVETDFMKTRIFKSPFLAVGLAAALTLGVGSAPAQDSAKNENPAASQAAPQLSFVVSQVVQLSKANIGEDTIITFVQNSGNNYSLDAAQIIYLKQQGVSANVINAMIKQFNSPGAGTPVVAQSSSQASYATTEPPTTTVQTAPAYVPDSTVYVPNTQAYNYYGYYYPYYPYYPYYYGYYGYGWPAVSFSFGWGGHWGGGYYGGGHGGYYGGGHGGGGHSGGGSHGGSHH